MMDNQTEYTTGNDPIVHVDAPRAKPEVLEVDKDVVMRGLKDRVASLESGITSALRLREPIRNLAENFIDRYLSYGDQERTTSTTHIKKSPIGDIKVTELRGGRKNETAVSAAEEELQPLIERGCQISVFGSKVTVNMPREVEGGDEFSYSLGTPVATDPEHAQLAKDCVSITQKSGGVEKSINITTKGSSTAIAVNRRDDNSGRTTNVGIFGSSLLFGINHPGEGSPLTVEKWVDHLGILAGKYEGLTSGGDTSLSQIVVVDPDDESQVWKGTYNQEGHSVTWKEHKTGRQELPLTNPVSVRAGEESGTLVLYRKDGSKVSQIRVNDNIFNYINISTSSTPPQARIRKGE